MSTNHGVAIRGNLIYLTKTFPSLHTYVFTSNFSLPSAYKEYYKIFHLMDTFAVPRYIKQSLSPTQMGYILSVVKMSYVNLHKDCRGGFGEEFDHLI